MRFSIVIPTFNNLGELQACLGALGRLNDKDFHVLVGVDGSTDGTVEWLNSTDFPFRLDLLQHPKGRNAGRAATRNLALTQLLGRYTLFLDSDMEAAPDMLDAHARVLDQGNTLSIGAVRYRNAGDNIWVRYTSSRGVAKFPNGSVVPFHYFITPNTAVPSAYFTGVGGFDAKIARYGGEDMEFGYRIHRKYHPQYIFNADAMAETTQPKTLAEALPQLREYGATGLRYIVAKWPELSKIYWVNKCESNRLPDRLFESLTGNGWQSFAKAFLPFSPFFLKKIIINFLVVANVHQGYLTGKF